MTHAHTPLTILLVDDDRTIVDIFNYGLRERGYEVHTASNVADALRLAGTIKIDCLLSDIQLPDQDGITLNSMIKELYPDVISILMTGYPGISSAIKGLRQNIHDYLIKPFSVEQVIASIERAVNSDLLRKENVKYAKRIVELEKKVQELEQELEDLKNKAPSELPGHVAKPVDHAHAHKIYLEQQGRLKQ